jgi:hypothetical protein
MEALRRARAYGTGLYSPRLVKPADCRHQAFPPSMTTSPESEFDRIYPESPRILIVLLLRRVRLKPYRINPKTGNLLGSVRAGGAP